MQTIQFLNCSPEQVESQITAGIKKELDNFLKLYKPTPPTEYLTRQNVADMFDINLSSVHNWSKKGILKPLAISGRIYYERKAVEEALTPLND
jgi:hypothetical protein